MFVILIPGISGSPVTRSFRLIITFVVQKSQEEREGLAQLCRAAPGEDFVTWYHGHLPADPHPTEGMNPVVASHEG